MIFRSTYSKPILLAGNGIRTSGAVKLLHEFAQKTNIPVLTTMNGVDLAQDDLHIGFIGTHGNRVANMIIKECDVIISIGARLGIRQAGKNTKNFAPQADLIRCDIDEYELSRKLAAGQEKARGLNIRLKALMGTLEYVTMNRELLQLKTSLHDNIGQCILIAKRYMYSPESVDKQRMLDFC